ncbi:MAG: hypothetical protein PQJ58_22040 [Spirochaetales bacterium]|nr:hypothetical protein [Spirochaetales bacterium]
MVVRKDRIIAAGLVCVLLLLYGYSLTRSLVSPPSAYMSREIPLAQAEYGFSKTVNSHVRTAVLPSGSSQYILCVDGSRVLVLETDVQGKILREQSFDLDLSRASLMQISTASSQGLGVFFRTDALYRADLSMTTGEIKLQNLTDKARYFDSDGESLVYGNRDGLFVLHPDYSEPVNIFPGSVLDFRLVCDGPGCYTLIIHEQSFDTVRMEVLYCSPSVMDCTTLLSLDVSAKYFSDLQDLRLEGRELIALYKYENGRNRTNEMMVQKIGLSGDKASILWQQSTEVPLYHSNYRLMEGEGNDVRFIYQTDSSQGVNLAMAVMGSEGLISTHLLSKTKSMSKLGGAEVLEGRRVLVFSDINYEKRSLLFASSDPAVMESTSRFRTLPFWYPFLTTVLVYFVSLITGSLYLLVLLPVPVLVMLITEKLVFHRMESPAPLQDSLITLVHTAVKIVLTNMIISSAFNYSFQPAFIGAPAVLLTVVILFTIPPVLLSLKKRGIDFYISFAVYDYLFYTGLVVMYLTTSILLTKV